MCITLILKWSVYCNRTLFEYIHKKPKTVPNLCLFVKLLTYLLNVVVILSVFMYTLYNLSRHGLQNLSKMHISCFLCVMNCKKNAHTCILFLFCNDRYMYVTRPVNEPPKKKDKKNHYTSWYKYLLIYIIIIT